MICASYCGSETDCAVSIFPDAWALYPSMLLFPPRGAVARVLAPFDSFLSRLHAPGAAFLAIVAGKPER